MENKGKFLDIFSKKKLIIKEKKENKKIIIDYREKNSLVPANLKKLGFELDFKELKVGDYILNNIIIERKTISDFKSSMINRRLITQLENLQKHSKKLLIIEGLQEQELYNDSFENGIHSNAIRGFLLSILLKYDIPIIYTQHEKDSAKYLEVLFKKGKKENKISLNISKKNMTKKEQLEFILESFPGIGPAKSKELLKKFGTIQNIINASEEDLKKIIGKKAEIMIKIINSQYQ